MIQSSALFKVDHQSSVSGMAGAAAYTAYGFQPSLSTSLGFTGQLREPNVGWYMLGNGRRVFNSKVMRFHSPDVQAPFGKGGLNAYCYCEGDPVNYIDPTGQTKDAISRWNAGKTFVDFLKAVKDGWDWLRGFQPALRVPTIQETAGVTSGVLKATALGLNSYAQFLDAVPTPYYPHDQPGYDAIMQTSGNVKLAAAVTSTVATTIDLLTPKAPDNKTALQRENADLKRENAMLRAALELHDEENSLLNTTRITRM